MVDDDELRHGRTVQSVLWGAWALPFHRSPLPATLPGGVLDSHPMMAPVEIAVPDDMAELAEQSAGRWRNGKTNDEEFDPLATH